MDRPKKKAHRLNAHLAFLDESGFLLIPTLRRTWAPRGQTPLLRHRYQHDKISAISAVTVSPRRQRLGLYLHCHPGTSRRLSPFPPSPSPRLDRPSLGRGTHP